MANSPGGMYGRPRRDRDDDDQPDDQRAGDGRADRISGRASVGGPGRSRGGSADRNGSANRNGSAGRNDAGNRPGGGRAPAGRTAAAGAGAGQPPKRRIKPRWDRIALVAGVAVLVLGLLTAGGLWLYGRNLNSKLQKTDPFSAIVGNRPVKTVDGALNILLLGSDSRDPDTDVSTASQWRADTIVLVHIPASHDKAYLVSMPRDLYVFVPKSQSSPYGNTYAKINAAFAWGGLPLAVQTVENYTGVRIDHVVSINFGGLEAVVDALGGVDMYVDQTITSIHGSHRVFTKGNHHFNGSQALDYVRQRKQFADGDFARVRHQQALLRALLDKATSAGTLTEPLKLNAFLQTITKAVTVDKDFALTDMVLQFRGLRSNNLTFMTSPNLGSETRDGESVVVSDKPNALALYDAMAKDTMDAYIAAHPTGKPSATS